MVPQVVEIILHSNTECHARIGNTQEDTVFISGIAFFSIPYYMDTLVCTLFMVGYCYCERIKSPRPDRYVWIITGDGDSLAIGEPFHSSLKKFQCECFAFNKQIYGLTKGQYSPTSSWGRKVYPVGSPDHPFNPSFKFGLMNIYCSCD